MERFLDRVQATPEKSESSETPSREIKVSGRPIPESIMDDLCSRFLLNIPRTEKDDMIRLMFQVELAHWFYIDFHRVEDPSLPEMRLPQFSGNPFLVTISIYNGRPKWSNWPILFSALFRGVSFFAEGQG